MRAIRGWGGARRRGGDGPLGAGADGERAAGRWARQARRARRARRATPEGVRGRGGIALAVALAALAAAGPAAGQDHAAAPPPASAPADGGHAQGGDAGGEHAGAGGDHAGAAGERVGAAGEHAGAGGDHAGADHGTAEQGDRRDHAAAALAELVRDNSAFVAAHAARYFDRFLDAQHPHTTLVACSDSRVHTQAFDLEPDDEIFVVRNIGNQVDATAGSVAYGVLHLKTPLLLVVGHVRCGAVRAAMGDYSREPPPIRRELDGLHLVVSSDQAAGTHEERWLRNVVRNVHQQVAFVVAEYADLVNSGQLTVVGGVYDFRNDLHHAHGRLVVVDVNGERDPAVLLDSPFVRRVRELATIPGGPAPFLRSPEELDGPSAEAAPAGEGGR